MIRDFPAIGESGHGLTPLEAFLEVRDRHRALQDREELLQDIFLPADGFAPAKLAVGVGVIHGYLFRNILSNAGQYRRADEPESGQISFGGQNRYESRPKFRGSPAENIQEDVHSALSYLTQNSGNPIEASMRFYQAFVKSHPFYDANGRIGRYLVSLYLRHFKYHVLWSEMGGGDSSKFIKKLNECHHRMGQPNFEEYMDYLVRYFRGNVRPFEDLEEG